MRHSRRFVLLCAAAACSIAASAPGSADRSAVVGKPAAASAKPANDRSLVGAWYGGAFLLGTDDEGDHVTINNADGSFVSYFRVCKDGVARRVAVETGSWSVDGDVERTVTLTINGRPVPASDYYVEHYALRWLSPDSVQKTLRKNGKVSHSRRLLTGVEVPANPCTAASQPQPR